ncbi:MAG: hypothetical protein MUD06_04145 [Rhodospirillales bacterium]|nr:hypothetical protein [Rhodospirillales bacterium]
MMSGRTHGRTQDRRPGPGAAALTGALWLLLSATGGAAAEDRWLSVENRSDHPVKLALPGTPAATIAPGAEPAQVQAKAEGATGVTARLWWTSDPRQLCQIYTPWERTITVTGSREIICRSR